MKLVQIIRDILKYVSISAFNPDNSTFKKEDLRILVLNGENEIISIGIGDVSGGEGGSQDLQQTLTNGGLVTDDNLSIEFDTGTSGTVIYSGYIQIRGSNEDTTASGILGMAQGGTPESRFSYAQLDLGYSVDENNNTFSHIVPNKNAVDTYYNLPNNTENSKQINLVGDAPIDDTSYNRKNGQWVSLAGNGQTLEETLMSGNSSSKVIILSKNGSLSTFSGEGLEIKGTSSNPRSTYAENSIIIKNKSTGDIEGILDFGTILGNFQLPQKTKNNTYTLAIDEDVSLTGIIDKNPSAVYGNNVLTLFQQGSENGRLINIFVQNDSNLTVGVNVSPNSVYFQSGTPDASNCEVRLDHGIITFTQDGIGGPATFSFNTNVTTGNYKIATEEDILQNLEEVLLTGGQAFLASTDDSKQTDIILEATETNSTVVLSGSNTGETSTITIADGVFSIRRKSFNSGQNYLKFAPLTSISSEGAVNVLIPAPSKAGDYSLALAPSINIVPTGNFTVLDGGVSRIITLTSATTQDIILPAIADSIGCIYFITNESSDGTSVKTVKSKTGSNDLFDGGTLVALKAVAFGMSLRFFNDGRSYKIIG